MLDSIGNTVDWVWIFAKSPGGFPILLLVGTFLLISVQAYWTEQSRNRRKGLPAPSNIPPHFRFDWFFLFVGLGIILFTLLS